MRYAVTNPNRGVLNHFFNDSVFDRLFEGPLTNFSPSVDIFEREDRFVIKADLPGLTEKDVDVEFHDGVLTLKGEMKREEADEGTNYYRRERVSGTFERSFRFKNADEKNISAKFENGVLNVEVPLKEEAKPKKINISIN